MRSTSTSLAKLHREVHALDSDSFAYRDSAIRYLESMLKRGSSASQQERDLWTSGLGRMILDDGRFSESDLGKRLINFLDDYRQHGLGGGEVGMDSPPRRMR